MTTIGIERILSNVSYYQNEVVKIEGTKIFFTNLCLNIIFENKYF